MKKRTQHSPKRPPCFIALALALALMVSSLPFTSIPLVHAEPEDGLILYYDFNLQNANSTIISDASGSQNSGELKNVNGKLEGAYSIEEVEIYGRPVHALHLAGGATGAYLQFPNGILYGNGAVTISAWVKLASNSAYQRVWDFGTGQDKYIYLLSDGRNAGFAGYASAITTNGWTNEKGIQKRDNIDKNRWVLTTLVMDGAKMTLYENGEQIGNTVDTGIRLEDLGVTTNNYLGYGQFSENPTLGWFAEVKIYNRALSGDEVKSMYYVDDAGIVSADKADLDMGDLTAVAEDIELPTTGINGSAISWTSKNRAVSIQGNRAKVSRPAQGKASISGAITAEITCGGASAQKSFPVTVLPEYTDRQVVEHDAEAIQEAVGDLSALTEDRILPTQGEWGSSIRWSSDNRALTVALGLAKVTRPNVGEQSAQGSLQATVAYGKEQEKVEIKFLVPPYRKSVAVKETEKIAVETLLGDSPSLPHYVRATYSDGSVRKLKAVWPDKINADYSSPGHFTVEGSLVGEKAKVAAEVTVVEGENAPKEAVAEGFSLQDATLDKVGANGSILTQNQERALEYLRFLDEKRMLFNFYQTFGQEEKLQGVEPLGGWEAPDGLLRGHSTGRYLSALAAAYASVGDEGLKGKLDWMIHELRSMQLLSKGSPQEFASKGVDQTLWSRDCSIWGEGYLGAYPPDQFALLEQYVPYGRIWSPYYTMHQLLAGLLDAYAYAGNEEALDCARDLGRWICRRLGACDKEQLSKMWEMETSGNYGGCNGSLARLFLYTGDMEFLEGAKLFDNTTFFHKMSKNLDDIAGKQAIAYVAQAAGVLEVYGATLASGSPEADYYDIAKNFWDLAVSRYSYSTGGIGKERRFTEGYQLAVNISGSDNCETCVAYDMLELTRMLNQYNPDCAEYMDYYERTLYNQVLPSQLSETASATHSGIANSIPISPGGHRSYSGDYKSFSCCHGAGMVSHVKYQEAAYCKTADTLYVGLYLPSSVEWREKGVKVVQETEFPSETMRLTVSSLSGMEAEGFQMKLRVPYWAEKGFVVKVNGKEAVKDPEASSYVSLENIQPGDLVEIKMPWAIHLDKTPDMIGMSAVASLMYGPFVMAARGSSKDWKTLILSENLEESFQASTDLANGFPILAGKEEYFQPLFAPEYAKGSYHAYFKAITVVEGKSIWHQAKAVNTTPKRGEVTLSADMVKDGDELVVMAYPKEGYRVKSLFINQEKAWIKADNTYIIKNVERDLEIIVSFCPIKAPVPDPAHLEYRATAYSDYTAEWEYLNGMKVNWEPESSNQGRIGLGWGNYYQSPGSEHFVQYEWDTEVSMNRFEVYWYDDANGTRIPGSIKILYWDEKEGWQEARMLSEYQDVIKIDRYNTIHFEKITTTAVRLVMTVLDDAGANGIYRWKVSLEEN